MISENFVWLALLISTLGAGIYLFDTLKGRVKPNKVTWILWAINPLIAFAAEAHQLVGIQSLFTFMIGFTPLIIFFASFVNKKAYWKITRPDVICGLFSILGLSLWYFTKVGNLAIVFSIVADAFAALPTLYKSYKNPETENSFAYLTASISGLITVLTIRYWNFETYAFPAYIFLINILIILAIKLQFGKKKSQAAPSNKI
jgi:hypothetical protein